MMAQDSRFFLVLGPSGRTRDKEGKTMKKLLKLLFVGVLMSAMAVLGLSSSTLAADPKTIKIGYTAPFTGAGAEYGTNGWRGIQLALEEVNKKGITIKGQQYKIEIIRYDSICTPTEAVANVRKLAMEDKVVAVLGDHCSSCCMAIAPLLDDFKIAGLTIECATAGFININDDYGHSFRDSFKAELAKHGVETVVEEDFERGTTDFTVYLTKIKRVKPDVAFYVGAISEGALIVKQARELGVTDQTALFGAEEMAEMELLSLAGADAIEGTYALALWGSVDPAFAKRVMDRFNAPMHYGIIFGYDALHVVAKAIESAQSLDSVKIRDALKKTDYQGLEGHVKFDSFEGYKNQGRFIPSIVKWVGGQRTVVD
jgi:branched-chain amino acid transport system substrate-binding protein